jgi:hypothetical protein
MNGRISISNGQSEGVSSTQAVQLAAVITGLIAALTLFYGSVGVPHEMQSWKGQTGVEKRWRTRQAIMKWIGIPAAVISAICQTFFDFLASVLAGRLMPSSV